MVFSEFSNVFLTGKKTVQCSADFQSGLIRTALKHIFFGGEAEHPPFDGVAGFGSVMGFFFFCRLNSNERDLLENSHYNSDVRFEFNCKLIYGYAIIIA